MIQLRDKSPSIVFEFAKLASSSNGRKRCYVWEILKCCWKSLRVWWEFEDNNNRPPSIPWNWVPAIFLLMQGRQESTYKYPFPTSLFIANIFNDLQDQFTSSLQNVGTKSKESRGDKICNAKHSTTNFGAGRTIANQPSHWKSLLNSIAV